MTDFPKIKGLKWLSTICPDLIVIKVTLEDKTQRDLGIKNLEVNSISSDYYVDLSKLAGIRDWYPTDLDVPAEDECMVDFDGITSFVANISKENLLQAWIFYKQHKT